MLSRKTCLQPNLFIFHVTFGLIYWWQYIQVSYKSNLNGFNFDLTRGIEVKYSGVGLTRHDFRFWFNCNTLLNSVPLHTCTTILRNLNNPDLDLHGHSR